VSRGKSDEQLYHEYQVARKAHDEAPNHRNRRRLLALHRKIQKRQIKKIERRQAAQKREDARANQDPPGYTVGVEDQSE
jgi:hypothetical protein